MTAQKPLLFNQIYFFQIIYLLALLDFVSTSKCLLYVYHNARHLQIPLHRLNVWDVLFTWVYIKAIPLPSNSEYNHSIDIWILNEYHQVVWRQGILDGLSSWEVTVIKC